MYFGAKYFCCWPFLVASNQPLMVCSFGSPAGGPRAASVDSSSPFESECQVGHFCSNDIFNVLMNLLRYQTHPRPGNRNVFSNCSSSEVFERYGVVCTYPTYQNKLYLTLSFFSTFFHPLTLASSVLVFQTFTRSRAHYTQ